MTETQSLHEALRAACNAITAAAKAGAKSEILMKLLEARDAIEKEIREAYAAQNNAEFKG